MKTKLLLICFLIASFTAIKAQEITVNTGMGTGYANQVYYKISSETTTSFVANSWDIAFLRESNLNQAIRVNGSIGIEVFEASNTPADWNAIDIANEATWTQLYNSDTDWNNGAFMKGSANTPPFGVGWGTYNPVTHHIIGSIIFVLKYADGTYRKLIIEDYFGAYTFKYSTWTGSAWSADQTAVVANSSNPANKYNYYSLSTDSEVVAEPAVADWDFVFTRYYTELAPNTMYLVTGALQSSEITVAQNEEAGGMPANPVLTYSTDINTIGYDWKSFTGAGFSVNSDSAFYVKYADNTIYRVYFSAFSGSSSGDLTFHHENVTSLLSVSEVGESVSFGIYPNPSPNKKINLLYDVAKLSGNTNQVAIYTTSGQKVFETALRSNSGFYNKELDLSSLKAGMYVLQFTSGDYNVTKKIVLR
ncbi:HmuY family protein [Kordia sp.]|uniref:T9SS type A sorting domain-containing protein n=1 Tax=Kordia sp. TaxID=1965332 RepID=UPI0025B7D07E|nr:HmuY family protein [Kordia sp.]MCH2193852.1 T9SS type A sorting domain-containing protein [Kordia sp.]